MDLEILKKKLSTYQTSRGQIRNVSDELLMEVLLAWEQWTGPTGGFSTTIGVSRKGISSIIGKAKKLKRNGYFPVEDFKEIKLQEPPSSLNSLTSGPCQGVEILWDNGKLIRFQQVEQLVDFLKKVA